MRSIVFALLDAVWSLKGVMGGVRGGPGGCFDGMGEWTYSAHWRSREQ